MSSLFSRHTAMLAAMLMASAGLAQPVDLGGRSIVDAARQLKPGEYIWAADRASDGPSLLIVNLETQRAILFRNGIPIGASTVSTGRPGYETPTGVFTILEKRKEHYSSTYNNAPMPNMQRLTKRGVALHAGKLPGYPDSHGCIRLPFKFSTLLFGATNVGMTVMITDIPAAPKSSAAPALAYASAAAGDAPLARAAYEWHPERSSEGMVSVVVSVADQRAVVLRGGVEIGSGPVRVSGPVSEAMAYALRAWDETGQHWLKLQLSGAGNDVVAPANEGQRFETPNEFRRAIATALRPGSIVIVTPQSLSSASTGKQLTVIENE